MGEPPDKGNTDCYIGYRPATKADDGNAIYDSACPVGYGTASVFTHYPFYRTPIVDQTTDGKDHRVTATDVVASVIYCCPSASGFGFQMTLDKLVPFTTVHDGVTYRGEMALMPMCVATSVKALSSGQTVTLTPYSDTRGWEKRQENTADGLSTAAWDPKNKVWAEIESFSNTVFADGYTCYDGAEAFGEGPCTEYCKQQSESFRPLYGCLGSHCAPETASLLPNTSRNTPKRNITADIIGRGEAVHQS
jgi:hypothetical protein